MAGGRGRGRNRATPSDPSTSAAGASGPSPSPSASTPSPALSAVGCRRACEACEAAPGMPFCRVEWSFLCASCGPALHRNSWIVAVPPFPGPGPGPGPTPPTNPSITGSGTSTSTDPSQPQPPPYYFPPFMQMPPMPPMHTPFQMPMPMHPPKPNASGIAGKKRRRRPRAVPSSKEQLPASAPDPADTDSDPDTLQAENERVVSHGMKRNTKSSQLPPTRTDTGDAYTELHPGVEETVITNMPESCQVNAIENLAAEMEPPPPELDDIEQVIEEQ